MGLDLFVSEQSDFRKDEKGRTVYTVTELYNFRGTSGSVLVNNCSTLSEMSNCSTVSVDVAELLDVLHDLKEEVDTINKNEVKDDYDNQRLIEYQDTIDDLEEFLEDQEIPSDIDYGAITYEFHLWY